MTLSNLYLYYYFINACEYQNSNLGFRLVAPLFHILNNFFGISRKVSNLTYFFFLVKATQTLWKHENDHKTDHPKIFRLIKIVKNCNYCRTLILFEITIFSTSSLFWQFASSLESILIFFSLTNGEMVGSAKNLFDRRVMCERARLLGWGGVRELAR